MAVELGDATERGVGGQSEDRAAAGGGRGEAIDTADTRALAPRARIRGWTGGHAADDTMPAA